MSNMRQIGEAFEKGLAITKGVEETQQEHLVREFYRVAESLREIEIPTDKEELTLYHAAMESIVAVVSQLCRRTLTRGQLIDIRDYSVALTKQLVSEQNGKYSFEGLAAFVVPQAPITFSHSDAKTGNAAKQKELKVFPFMNK